MITRFVLAAAIAAIGVTTVVAQSDPLAARKAIMKGVGDQSRIAQRIRQRALRVVAIADDERKTRRHRLLMQYITFPTHRQHAIVVGTCGLPILG